MKRAAIYGRYSSDNQREESIEDQISSCFVYAKAHNIVIDPKHIYTDSATSGQLRDREGLNNLLQAAREKKFDVVLVDDLSRLSRVNAQMLIHIQELNFMGIPIISVADNIDTSDEESKLTYQLKGIINEAYVDDLRKKTIRGQLGQKQRGFFIGEKTFGYKSEPYGNVTIDKKGKSRPEGYKIYIEPQETAVVKMIFQMADEGSALTRIVKDLNAAKVPNCKNTARGWNLSTIHRILRNEKYIGRWAWGKRQNKRNPITGVIRQVTREKPLFEAEYEELRIIPQEQWERVQAKLISVEKNWKAKGGNPGFAKGHGSLVKVFPKELLSGSMVCSVCGGTICKVSGKGDGYYGCLRATKGGCTNKLLVRKNVAEPIILGGIGTIISNEDSLQFILKKVEEFVAKMCATVPEDISLKKTELSKVEKMVQNFVTFIAEGRSSKAIADSLSVSEQKMEALKNELLMLEATHKKVFKSPPMEWITERVAHVKEVLEEKTEQSALLLRKLLGQITLQPVTPDIGKPYLMATSKLQPLALFEEKRPQKGPLSLTFACDSWGWDTGSNVFFWWRWRESNPRPKIVHERRLHAYTSICFSHLKLHRPGYSGSDPAKISLRGHRPSPRLSH